MQELAAQSDMAAWAIGSMLFFLAVFLAIVVWVVRKHPDEMARNARMPLDQDSGIGIRESGSRESGVGSQESGVKTRSGNSRSIR